MAESRGERWFIAPYFFVPDVVSAAHYYIEKTSVWDRGDPWIGKLA